MERFEVKQNLKEFKLEDDYTVWVRISSDRPDRKGYVIEQNFVIPHEYIPVIVSHDWEGIPIGRIHRNNIVTRTVEDGHKETYALVEFASKDVKNYELAELVKELAKKGYFNTVSVGLLVLEEEPLLNENGEAVGRKIKKSELVELSFVVVPANRDAEVVMREFEEKARVCLEENKCFFKPVLEAVNRFEYYKNLPVDMDSAWDKTKAIRSLRKWASRDGSGDKDTIDWKKYRLGFAWYDASKPEQFGSYKLPFCWVANGKLTIVRRGVITAMAVLLGAMGGVNIPENERRKVYNLLARIYREKLEMDPPEYKQLEDVQDVVRLWLQGDNSRKMLKEYRKLFKKMRTLMGLPKMSDEKKAIEQAYSFLEELCYNRNEDNRGGEPASEKRSEKIIKIKLGV